MIKPENMFAYIQVVPDYLICVNIELSITRINLIYNNYEMCYALGVNILTTATDLLVNYGPVTITAGIALFYLKKDWKTFEAGNLRWLVFIFICVLWIVGVLNIYTTDEKNDHKRAEDKQQIGELTTAVRTAKESQENNTKQFIEAFEKLLQKVSVLQSEVKTAGLRERANSLEAELKATQKSLEPKKATLDFSFVDPNSNKGVSEFIHEITLPVKDNVVHVEYSIVNKTDVFVPTLEIILVICDECEFATEPADVTTFAGQPKNQRNILPKFGIPQMAASRNLSVDIKVPPKVTGVALGVDSRCPICDVQKITKNTGIITLQR